jgi:hypothetical protein
MQLSPTSNVDVNNGAVELLNGTVFS